MSEEEQRDFCGHICMAARRLGIYLEETETPQGFEFMFADQMGGRFISGRRKPERKAALLDACQELQSFLCAPPSR